MQNAIKSTLKSHGYFTLEITPTHGISSKTIIEKLENTNIMKKISGFVVTDNPLAKLKSNSIVTAYKLQTHFNKPAIATMTMRDKNKIGLQSDLLGANELGVTSILALTGDSAGASDQPNVKGVFESNSLLLLEIIKCFNNGMDYAGRPLKDAPEHIYPFCVCNAKVTQPRALTRKISSKLKFNPEGVITQPIYDTENAKAILEILKEAKENANLPKSETELILGFFPVTKLRTAQFLHSHVPGVYIPESWIEKLTKAKAISDEEERKVGVELSRKTFNDLKKLHPKIHIMGANNFELLDEITD
ncbi:MAG: methylenetetrahydrofolate reductase [Campylobacteraceae bacterium]